MRRPMHLFVLILLGSLILSATALAAAPPAKEGTDMDPAAAKNPMAQATPSLNPITAVTAMNRSIQASEQQTKAAMESMTKAEDRSAQKATAPRPGGGKVIYGDIIIHK